MRALVTGGAGFIGSHLIDRLIADGADVTVLDDLSAGREENVNARADLVTGCVTDESLVAKVVGGAEFVFHQAAHRAVPRSVEHPLETDRANVHGTLNILVQSRDARVRRVVSASSSSVYGNVEIFPTPENEITWPRSPYAVSKLAGEHYCRVFSELYGMETVSLRYFNVYGPRQRPDAAYAAVIPLFISALRSGTPPEIHGDGLQSRDFTYVEDVVEANIRAATCPKGPVAGRAYNVAGGESHSLLDLLAMLQDLLGTAVSPVHVDERPGDVKRTEADTSAARRDLGFSPRVTFRDGLARTVAWTA